MNSPDVIGMLTGALIAVTALALVSCANLGPTQRLQIACSSYADTIQALSRQNERGLLSGASQARIDAAIEIIAPVCERRRPFDPANVVASIELQLLAMIDERNQANGG
jgi:hypothetical protein